MKNIKLIASIMLIMCLCGCSTAYEGSDTAQQDRKVTSDFTLIDGYDNLYYCNETNIVYWIGGSYQANLIGEDYTTSYMTVYYAPNGLPYIYDINSNKLCEIEK